MDSSSDAEVIRRSLDEPEAFGLVYDRHAATVLHFLGRRVGAEAAEGLLGELFRIAFERRKTFDPVRATALPWLYGIGSNLLLRHRRAEARRLRASARMAAAGHVADRRTSAAAFDARVLFPRVADAIDSLPKSEREALLLFVWEKLPYESVAEALDLPIGTVRSRLNRAAPSRIARAEREREEKITMKPVDLAKKLRREAALEPAVLDRGKAALMAAIRQEVQPLRRPTIIPRLPYENVGAALSFLERAFGFREVAAARGVRADGAIDYTMVEFGDGMIGLGAQGAHGAFSPKRAGTASQYITVHVDDIDAHHQRALASGAEIVSRLHDHLQDYRVYEALDLEGHRWRFLQWLREVPQSERR
jgi:RNA polymerase sigma factor (sigma-70 family)